MLRLCFLTRALTAGGSERQLVELATRLDPDRFAITVLTFYPGGGLWDELAAAGRMHLISLDKRGRFDLAGFAWRAWRKLRQLRPHVVHGYLGSANELALLLGRLVGARVVWRVGAAWMDLDRYDWGWRVAFGMGRWLSRWPDAIVVNSHASRRHHEQQGWDTRRLTVIPNGFDTGRFARDVEAGLAMRRTWGIPRDADVIGLVARLDPIKDHPTFLEAVARHAATGGTGRFVCVGDGPRSYAESLRAMARRLGVEDRVAWVGEVSDVRAAYNALDLATLCSVGESLPNALGEAMACEVPCVATRVGDVPDLVGDTGLLIDPRDPAALAGAWARLLASPDLRRDLGARARSRIDTRFGVAELARRSTEILERVAAGGAAGAVQPAGAVRP
jgi:glycosyltransferase involved in cell wall biosynthesis